MRIFFQDYLFKLVVANKNDIPFDFGIGGSSSSPPLREGELHSYGSRGSPPWEKEGIDLFRYG